jgi:hypothetical protein
MTTNISQSHNTRESWLQAAVHALEPVFSKAGFAIPPVKISCGWPASSSPRTTMGQCWPRERSGDMVNEIFISPRIDDSVEVLDTLVHELCHAIDDCHSGHGEDFKDIAHCVGLEGPAKSAHATEELKVRLMMIAKRLGNYPHKAIVFPPPRASNQQRNKAKCGQCGYEVTLLKKWASMGAPICPKDNIRMEEASLDVIEETPEEEKLRKDKEKEIKRAIC